MDGLYYVDILPTLNVMSRTHFHLKQKMGQDDHSRGKENFNKVIRDGRRTRLQTMLLQASRIHRQASATTRTSTLGVYLHVEKPKSFIRQQL